MAHPEDIKIMANLAQRINENKEMNARLKDRLIETIHLVNKLPGSTGRDIIYDNLAIAIGMIVMHEAE